MSESILTSTKKNLGLEEDYTAFDPDILMHINGVLSTLTQLGIGPPEGYYVQDKTTNWADFLGADPRLNSVRTYVYFKVRLAFDPPATSFHVNALQEQARELEWRLNVQREGQQWVDPNLVMQILNDLN